MLASCDSAGSSSDDENAPNQLAALGPRLSQAGIPAVIAMQGRISMETGKSFMKVFFEELQKDGVVDRAASIARSAVQDRPDWWKPVLFMRLRTGRLWYSRGLDKGRLDQWDVLVRKIEKQKCTPILGPALNDYLLGGRREIVRRWAEREHYPLALDRESLPQVAQYLKSRHDSFTMRDKLNEFFSTELRQTYGAEIHQVLKNLLSGLDLSREEMEERVAEELNDLDLNETIRLVGGQYIETDKNEPHRVLAQLGLPLYITTNANDLLADGIRYHGREPRVELYRWKDSDDVDWPPSIFDENQSWHLSTEEPLVYHLFGHLSQPETVVLSEDDYFDYLMGLDRNKSRLPPQVGSALNDSSLLFLGFRMDDWGFRVLFRSLMRRGGAGLRTRHAHVAVQIDPEGEFTSEPENARLYLTKYFGSENISLYWGSPRDFVEELSERLGVTVAAQQMNAPSNPYVGPRAFKRGEQLYGREQEGVALTDLLLSERIVLLYSPSGAGKSSLVEAAVATRLENDGFHVLPTLRVSDRPVDKIPEGANPFLLSVLLKLDEHLNPETPTPLEKLARITLKDFLTGLEEKVSGGRLRVDFSTSSSSTSSRRS